MGRMSLWQIMKYRSGWIDMNSPPKTEEEAAKDEVENISDDDFFAAMEADIVEGDEIAEDQFLVAIKKGGL